MQPRWRRDGKELFYLSLDGVIMAAEIGSGTVRAMNGAGADGSMIGAPHPLFQTHLSPSPNVPQYTRHRRRESLPGAGTCSIGR